LFLIVPATLFWRRWRAAALLRRLDRGDPAYKN
jgi:hypothetical protein